MKKKMASVITLIALLCAATSCGNTDIMIEEEHTQSTSIDKVESVNDTDDEEKGNDVKEESIAEESEGSIEEVKQPFSEEIKNISYLSNDDSFLLETEDGVQYVADREGNVSNLTDADIVTPMLSLDWEDNTISDIYGNDVTDKFIKEENQIALGIEEYDRDQVVWVLQREEGFSESYVKYIGYTSNGERLIEFDSKEYPEILYGSLFENDFSSGYPVYKGHHIFALRKPYTGMGGYITTDGEDLTELNSYLNVDTKTIFSLDDVSRGGYDTIFENYAFYWDKLYDLNGNLVKEYETKMWYLGEGKVMNADDSWLSTESRYIYDMVTGEQLIDLSEYQYTLQWVDKFADGYILIDIENDQGHEYLGVMNENGEWAVEPYKVEEDIAGETVGKVADNKILLRGVVYNLSTGEKIKDPVAGVKSNVVRLENKAYYLFEGSLTVYDYETEETTEIDLFMK